MVAFFVCGCATTTDTALRQIRPAAQPEPVRIAVLPPRIHPSLRLPDFKPDNEWYQRLADGRGTIVTSTTPERHITLDMITTLSQAHRYLRIFPVQTKEDARRLGANRIMTCTIHDYRTVLLGANARYPEMALTSILMSQYWIRWLTLEARLDWEVELTVPETGECTFKRRLARTYAKTVRYATSSYFTEKMLTFLRCEATPEFVGELFELEMVPRPLDGGAIGAAAPRPEENAAPPSEPVVEPVPSQEVTPPPPTGTPKPRIQASPTSQ